MEFRCHWNSGIVDTKEEADAWGRSTIRTLEPTQLLFEVSDSKNARPASLTPHIHRGCARGQARRCALCVTRMFGAFT